MILAAGTKLGPYEIVAPLGSGGMGEVYRARDPRLGRDVAVKVLPPISYADPDRLRRFDQEARAAAALNHPNILAVYDFGTHAGAPYVVSELLEGVTMREALRPGPFPPWRAVDYAIQIADGLAATHEKGIIHRDLKPENLFVTSDGRVKILDYGLAKLMDAAPVGRPETLPTRAAETMPGTMLGTVGYMSPEQVRGQTTDHRSDIFSLGAILYEMLTGDRAFKGDSPADTLSAILDKQPPDLSTGAAAIAPPLGRIVRHCLEKSADQRFQGARDVVFALREVDSQTPVRLRAAIGHGRERAIWAATVAVLLVIVAALGYQLLETRRAVASPTRLRLVTTQRGTVASIVGTGLVDLINRTVPGVRLDMIELPAMLGGGGIRYLDAGQAEFAITFNLLAFHAVKTDQLLRHRSDAITALTVAWAAPAQIVVRSDSDVKTITDLKGKRVSLDVADTGGQFCSQLLLSHFGLNSTDVLNQFSDITTSLENMRQDRLDAYIAWRGVPIPEFTEAFTSGTFRLISLDPESLQGLRLKHPFLAAYTLPPRVYPHQDQPIVTVSSRMLLVASRSLRDDLVNQVMTAIAANMPDLIARHPAAAEIQVKKRPTIDDGLSIDLHPGAERFFESVSR